MHCHWPGRLSHVGRVAIKGSRSVVLTPEVGTELFKGENFGFLQFGSSDVIVVFQKD